MSITTVFSIFVTLWFRSVNLLGSGFNDKGEGRVGDSRWDGGNPRVTESGLVYF